MHCVTKTTWREEWCSQCHNNNTMITFLVQHRRWKMIIFPIVRMSIRWHLISISFQNMNLHNMFLPIFISMATTLNNIDLILPSSYERSCLVVNYVFKGTETEWRKDFNSNINQYIALVAILSLKRKYMYIRELRIQMRGRKWLESVFCYICTFTNIIFTFILFPRWM